MLHEILLSLSGHPSPLLRSDLSAEASAAAGITPAEQQLLSVAAHLSDVHIKLINSSARISNSHPSAICRAVATAIKSVHLAAFQRKVLDVEAGILAQDPEYVGAYNIVPLTAIMGEFKQWIRRMDWLWDVVQFMSSTAPDSSHLCWGAKIMQKLRAELQSGYRDVEETAASLVKAAETTWLRQVSAWVFYGKLPAIGGDDFFIQQAAQNDFTTVPQLVPLFVTPATASSILFIGKSINLIRNRNSTSSAMVGMQNVAARLQDINRLSFPINSVSLAKTVAGIRQSLSENTLQSILPLEKVVNMLLLLREFMLLGRGEFAMAISQEADERIRNRWRRAGNLGHEKGDEGVQNVVVKDGEVAAVLTRAWSSLVTLQGRQSDDDSILDQARDLLRLHLVKSAMVPATGPGLDAEAAALLAASPFNTTLFSVPVTLSIQLPSPLDMVISPSDLQIYSCVNAYLLSLRRAHIRLTDLWKLTSLRRHHPCPRGTDEYAIELRKRWSARSFSMRSSWTTASAAIFFLGETEAYLQTEIVSALWQGFYAWLTTGQSTSSSEDTEMKDSSSTPCHDQQALATGHTLYLRTLAHRLLLTQQSFTVPLFSLLMHIDHLVTHTHRLHSIYTAIDLETDAGVLDTSSDLHAEQAQVTELLTGVQAKVRRDIETVIEALENLSNDSQFLAAWEGDTLASGAVEEDDLLAPGQAYKPQRLGGLDRLLRKLDFGSWFGKRDDVVYPGSE